VAHCLGLTFCPLPECAEFVCCDVLYVVVCGVLVGGLVILPKSC